MKICATIAEYNPFHLGHQKHIDYMKGALGAEKVIVIMSGNFTQRGEIAVLDKFTRASHAIKAGASLVIELPTVFATANAETFAKGAVNILSSLNAVDGICFGVESGNKASYLELAKAMNNESKEFKKALKDKLENGVSLAKAKFEAIKELGDERFDEALVSSPNNVLGLEYTKAILSLNSKMDIFPMFREGDHNDKTLKKGITSATSIREAIKNGNIKATKKCVPPFVFSDFNGYPIDFEKILLSAVITATAEQLALCPDCTEGLENRIKAFIKDNHDLQTFVDKISTKRYTKTRVQRILLSNLLGITNSLVKDCLSSPLYAKVLAVDKRDKEIISLLSSKSTLPLLTRKSDSAMLKKTALNCFEKDTLASDLYALVSGKKQNENQMILV